MLRTVLLGHGYVDFSQILYSSLLGRTFSISLRFPVVLYHPSFGGSLFKVLLHLTVFLITSLTLSFSVFGSVRFEELAITASSARRRMEDVNTVRSAAWYAEGIIHNLFVRIQE